MATINAYQIDLLKPYLNTKEMNFIENIDVESQKLNQMLTKETEHRDIMANFIDHLKDAISRLEDDQSNEEFLGVLAEVQDIFQKSNENIESTQNLILLFNTIYEKVKHDSIMPISNASEARITVNAVMQFKDVLNEFMTKNEEVKSKLFLSNIKFDTFWQRSNIKEYVAIFEKNANSSFSQKGRNHLRNQEKVTIPNIENIEENHTLLISEKLNKVFLPFTKQEISLYLEQYPNDFRSLADVIKKEFILSYVQEQGTSLKMIYETIVLSIYCVLTIAMNGALDYVKTPNGNISHSMNTQYSANPQYRFLLDNLNKFNKLVSKGELRKLCDAVLKKENFIGGALMTGIGIPKAITGVALVASAIMIIPVIRELLYLFYNFRMVTSEFFETQATLLELNIIELKNSNGKNADKIAKKQQKYVEKLRKLSNKFEIEFSKAEKQTKKELNTKISTDDISNLLIDTQENPSGFSFV